MKSFYKQMRMILIYDLPMIEKEDIKIYNMFRKNILKCGFYKIQFSVYTKVLQNETSYNQIRNKLIKIIPNKGSIVIFKVTEKQYQDMIYLRGTQNKIESVVGGKELVIFGGDLE